MVDSAFSKMVCLFVVFGILSLVFTPMPVNAADSKSPMKVRLRGGATANTGRLEVRYNNSVWRLVCNTKGWDMKDLEVVCRMLDYPGVKEQKSTSFSPFNCGSWLVDVRCTGKESSLDRCTNNKWKKRPFCLVGEYVVVTCKTYK